MVNIVFYNIGWGYDSTPFIGSIRKHMPDAIVTQLSDMDTPKVEGVDRVIREPRSFGDSIDTVHYEGFKLLSSLDMENIIFADMDFLFNDNIEYLLQTEEEVSVCPRSKYEGIKSTMKEKFPYCSVMVVKNMKFWKDCYQVMLGLKRKWSDNMLAVGRVVNSGKYTIRLLEESLYNRMPKHQDDYHKEVKIFHFKGGKLDRKQWMGHFYNTYISGGI